ncbi:MAG: putative restriction endonuclease [Patiriisocius sp.]|jgi:predicted restriction endonuclease
MITNYQDLKSDLKTTNITESTKKLAYSFLKIFEKEENFELSHKLKDKKCDIYFKPKNKSLNYNIKFPFSLYIGKNSMTFYFRENQELLTKNSELLNIYIRKPTSEKPKGDYYAKIHNEEDIHELINFVFVKKNRKTVASDINFTQLDNLYDFTFNEIESEDVLKRLGLYRDGQQKYRNSLLNRWNSKCAVTNLNHPSILISSHIKPFKDSNSNEKYDIENGILLSPNLDSLFDRNLISFEDNGNIILSNKFTKNEYSILGISENMKLKFVYNGMKKYLKVHRKEFKVKNE